VIVADTGAIIAMIDRDEPHHRVLREAFEARPGEWVLPWVILPEVDYLLRERGELGAAHAFFADLAEGAWSIEWNALGDLLRAHEIEERYRDLEMGLTDAVVMAIAERLEARAIATLDLRDFAAVELAGKPQLWPRDL
jgi:predicted nucleic acid-binding protein